MAIDYVNLYKGVSVIRKNGFEKSFIDSDMMIPWKYEDYLSNTQGHDFFSIFATVCSTKKGISQENISASARVVYSISDLQQTVLYKDLCNYSNAIRRKIIS